MEKLYIGAAYYPELWDESEIDNDIVRCKQLGINTLRVGEFAWAKMEPEEGVFDFGWLTKVVDKLYENGIYTVMCTPTATPPRWLFNKYPETRKVMEDLIRADVSSRQHSCKTSEILREKTRVIVTEMAKAFAKRKGIIGWQIDNELFPYNEGCYCENCKNAFRKHLKQKFGSVDKLNQSWGMMRWSLCYSDFNEIEPPYPKQWRHPSLRKEWWNFQCRQIKLYVDEQAEILHSYGCKNVGTDMMAHNYLSYYDVNEKLDTVQFNHYNPAGELADTAFSYDFLRCVKDKPFWVTETQVGWNGSEYADCGYRPAGNCYINTFLPIAKGGEMNLYWLFRAPKNGQEMAHGALYSTAGRLYRVSEEVKRACADLEKCEKFLTGSTVKSKIAIHFSSTAENSLSAAPLVKDIEYRSLILKNYYSALRHYNVDLIDTPHSLDGYEVLISPFLATADENGLKERVCDWVKNGGTWIVGPMSDIMNGDVSKYTHSPFGFLEELAGVYTKYQKPIDNNVFKARWTNDGECFVSVCFDAYECREGTKSLAHYIEGEFAPLSVITERKVGKGKVILVGSVISHGDLLRLINRSPVAEAGDNVILVERSGRENGIIAVEAENRNGYIVLDGEYKDLITGRRLSGRYEIAPYEALVLEKLK